MRANFYWAPHPQPLAIDSRLRESDSCFAPTSPYPDLTH